MSNWKILKTYCRYCDKWWPNGRHLNCADSLLWIDLETFQIGCNKCSARWALEDDTWRCNGCNNNHKTEYRDSTVYQEVGDQVIASDGDFVYILKRSGTVVVGRRNYTNTGYQR